MKKELFIVTRDVSGVSVLTKTVLKEGDSYWLPPERIEGNDLFRKATDEEIRSFRDKQQNFEAPVETSGSNTEPGDGTQDKEVE